MYSDKNLEEIKTIILSEFTDVETIYLFGSYAKKTANEQSDLDIAIILNKKRDWKERKRVMTSLYKKTSQVGYTVDFLLKDLENFKKDKKLPTISKVIENEGIKIWEKN